MDINEALKITGFQLCEFTSDGEDQCSTCDKPIAKNAAIYYERTSHESEEGEYHCTQCVIKKPAEWRVDSEAIAEQFATETQAP